MLAAAGAAILSQAAQAQDVSTDANPGDLILGLNKSGASDYIIDLGAITGSHVDFSSRLNLSTFTAQFGASPVGVNAGVVGGDIGLVTPQFVYTTTAFGASAPTKPTTQAQVQLASGNVSGLAMDPSLSIVVAPSVANSWSASIALNPTSPGTTAANNFVGNMPGANPLQTFGSSKILKEDLWQDTNPATGTAPWQKLGTLTFDLSGASPSITFDAVAVPEPTTYGLVAGAGLLVLSLRRRLSGKTS